MMRLISNDIQHGQAIAADFAMGAADGFAANISPHLAWSDVPDGVQSFALLCIDVDAPSDAALVMQTDVDIAVAHPRSDFVHWVVADIPASTREIAQGASSTGISKGGKAQQNLPGSGGREGLNDYSHWFAGDSNGMAGEYYGYDGPYPPAHDLRLHRYFFRLFALDVAQLSLPARFGAADVFAAMHGHVLAEASLYGTYSLHPQRA